MIVITPNTTFGPFKDVVILPLGLLCDDSMLPFAVIGDSYVISHDDTDAPVVVIKDPVPESVTMLQASLALYAEGSLSLVDNYIAAMKGTEGDQARIVWIRAGVVRRNHPLVAVMGQVLNKTDEQLDDLFRFAAKCAVDN